MGRLLLLALLAVGTYAAEEAHGHAAAHGDPLLLYKWLNFGILAAGLGYLIVKLGKPAYAARRKAILDGLSVAEKRAKEAAARAAEIDARMASLSTEVEEIRRQADSELAAEAGQIAAGTAEQITKVRAAAQHDIEATTKASIGRLRTEAAALALRLAEEKIRAQHDAAADEALVGRFIAALNRQD
jgi:F-type H+-transporting ATPase subunit b